MIALALLLSLGRMSAQDFKPTTTWPYVYSDFIQGELREYDGAVHETQFNIHLAAGTLHFIEDGMIREASTAKVFSLRIGKDYYANVGGVIMQILANSDNGFVAKEVKADYAALNNTGGAYGSSSNSISTQALSSMEGIGGSTTNMNHMELKNSKEDGSALPTTTKLYLVLPDKVIFATKKDINNTYGVDKKAFSAFLKENKVSWKNPQDLIAVIDFIANN